MVHTVAEKGYFVTNETSPPNIVDRLELLKDYLYHILDSELSFSSMQTCGQRGLAYVLTLDGSDRPSATHIEFVMTRKKGHPAVDGGDCACTSSNDDLRRSASGLARGLTSKCRSLLGPGVTASFKLIEKD